MNSNTFVISTSRLENFSDGVFTIILTLLAFQFRIPKFKSENSLPANLHELVIIAPFIIGFVFSFLFVAVFWVNHHHLYNTLKQVNSKLLWFNIHSLFWITMIPFSIAMAETYPMIQLSAAILGFVILMASISAYLLLRYSHIHSKLVDESLSHQSIHFGLSKNKAAIVVTVLGIIASAWHVYASYIIYVIVLIIFMIPLKLEKEIRFVKRKQSITKSNSL